MYSIIRNSDFRSSHVHLVTDNLQEYMSSTIDYIGMTITPHVRDIVSEFIALLYSLKSEVDIRYSTLNDTNNKNFEYYNIWLDPKRYYKMEPMVICWLGADKILKQMNHEETYELLKTFLRLGQVTGVTLLLHSDKPYGIHEAVDNDIYAQFVQINIPATKHAEDITALIGDKEYHTSVVQKDMV